MSEKYCVTAKGKEPREFNNSEDTVKYMSSLFSEGIKKEDIVCTLAAVAGDGPTPPAPDTLIKQATKAIRKPRSDKGTKRGLKLSETITGAINSGEEIANALGLSKRPVPEKKRRNRGTYFVVLVDNMEQYNTKNALITGLETRGTTGLYTIIQGRELTFKRKVSYTLKGV